MKRGLEQYKIHSYNDYSKVAKQLKEKKILSLEKPFAVLIGPSGHSPVPEEIIPSLIDVLKKKIFEPNEIEGLWGGGDPCFNKNKKGYNVADIKKKCLEEEMLKYCGCIQRSDWISRAPNFETIRVAYDPSLSILDGKKTFGGWEKKGKSVKTLVNNLWNETECNNHLLPPLDGLFVPVAATAGYLMAFPSFCKKLILIVVMQAGFITLKELEYIHMILQQNPLAPILVYGLEWKNIGYNLTFEERSERCKLQEITQLFTEMKKEFPEQVHILNVSIAA